MSKLDPKANDFTHRCGPVPHTGRRTYIPNGFNGRDGWTRSVRELKKLGEREIDRRNRAKKRDKITMRELMAELATYNEEAE